MAQCLSSLGPIPSQPLDFVGSSEDSALKTSESEKDIEYKRDGDSGMESMFGRMNGLLVKTEWKKLLKSSAFSVSLVALESFKNTVAGMELFLLREHT